MCIQQIKSDIYVFIGGTRSGKSLCAEQKVHTLINNMQHESQVLYVATAQSKDDFMQKRILTHQQRRPQTWDLLECPLALAAPMEKWLQKHSILPKKPIVLIDCVTLWLTNILFSMPQLDEQGFQQNTLHMFEARVQQEISHVLLLAQTYTANFIFVSGETGLGGIGATALERTFHDGLGLANQLLVTKAKQAFLVIAGKILPLADC